MRAALQHLTQNQQDQHQQPQNAQQTQPQGARGARIAEFADAGPQAAGPQAIAQRQRQAIADRGPQAAQLQELGRLIDSSLWRAKVGVDGSVAISEKNGPVRPVLCMQSHSVN